MNISSAWINGRSLTAALKKTGAKNRFDRFLPTDRVPLDLERDTYMLGIEHNHGFPFVVENNLLVTIHDFDLTASPIRFEAHDGILTLANLRFSQRALKSANSIITEDDDNIETLRIERIARSMDIENIDQAYKFSKDVCAWGKDGRVWGKLTHFNPKKEELGRKISKWLQIAEKSDEPSQAIAPGVEINGLGVSFASKHLRLFDPVRFATLDEVISTGLGYARNCAGYNLWLHDLQQLKHRYELQLKIADIESAIFFLIKQIVRGIPE